MKKVIFAILLFIMSNFSLMAQDWLTDFEEAKILATEQNQNILLVFKGSDWCAPCMKLEKEIFETSEFKKYATGHFVLMEVDFPRKKKNKLDKDQQAQNGALAEKYNQQGIFPLVVLLDKKGKVLGHTGYEKIKPSAYIDLLASLEK